MDTNDIDVAALFQDGSLTFDKLCQTRWDKGAKEYGGLTFVGNDVIRMMLEELADTANYCRMQFMKLLLLQEMLEQKLETETVGDQVSTEFLGIGSFKGTKSEDWL